MGVVKVQRVSVTDQVFDILVKKIFDGEWKVGEKIPSEIDLAQQLGVSRVSLKIALQKLNTLGVTETRVGEGTFVCEFNMKKYFSDLINSKILNVDLNQVNEFRILLEYCAMYLAVTKPQKSEMLSRLEDIFGKMSSAINENNDDAYNEQHFLFHRTICEMSENFLFIQLFDSMDDLFFNIYKSNSEHTWKTLGKSESIIHHQQILDALRNCDIARVTQLQGDLLADEHIKA